MMCIKSSTGLKLKCDRLYSLSLLIYWFCNNVWYHEEEYFSVQFGFYIVHQYEVDDIIDFIVVTMQVASEII